MENYAVISFDADQTLFDFNRIMFEALDAVCEHLFDQHGIEIQSFDLQAVRDDIAAECTGIAMPMLELRRKSFERVLLENSVSELESINSAMQLFEEIRFGRVYFYEDTLPALRHLARYYQLALITNGNSTPVRAQIGEYFSYTVLAEKYGFRKPDRRLFAVLLDEAGIQAQQLIHVGDSLATDVLGALNVGATSVYLNRDNRSKPPGCQIVPHFEITKLTELYEIIGNNVD